ncbi:MAG: methylmalonyl-CoA epimerase [Gemmatimonadota bacterium]
MHKIDHIGIAVKSLAEAVPAWEALLGINASGAEEVPSEGVRVAFFGDGPGRVELLEATGADSAIARHIERRGPGIHHLCLRVADLETALDRAAEAGLTPVPPGIRVGAGGHRVAFLHPRTTGGVLLELSEIPPA